jgi:hypothetical protein
MTFVLVGLVAQLIAQVQGAQFIATIGNVQRMYEVSDQCHFAYQAYSQGSCGVPQLNFYGTSNLQVPSDDRNTHS